MPDDRFLFRTVLNAKEALLESGNRPSVRESIKVLLGPKRCRTSTRLVSLPTA